MGSHSSASKSLLVSNLLIPFAVLIFATGFFPYKPFLPGLASHAKLHGLGRVGGDPPPAQFDRLVFMVVDALRSDFVFGSSSGFEYTQELIRKGAALPFTAHAAAPTITMPRVKALSTGSIPSFLDVILNFAESDTSSTLAQQDTWLAQIRAAANGSLVMYGDDTWLKLFPGFFAREDGTTSFFVSDFTEVDNNVTRHVAPELQNDDWSAMVLHYLGLDHIGHKAGPRSPNMVPKHREMDDIVRKIYEAMLSKSHLKSTLFILCGDHGMSDSGNHGGSTPGETSAAMVFMSPKLEQLSPGGRPCPIESRDGSDSDFHFYTKIGQSDVAATISGLLGVPMPLNNLGVFVPEFLPLWADENDRLKLLYRNALQMTEVLKANFPSQDFVHSENLQGCEQTQRDATRLACNWKMVSRKIAENAEMIEVEELVSRLTKFCRDAQDVMSGTATNYDVPRLVAGIILTLTSLISVLISWSTSGIRFNSDLGFFAVAIFFYSMMMFASSYVEEEQHFWYWATSGWLAFLHARMSQTSSYTSKRITSLIITLFLHRFICRWNQTGQKHAGAPDIAHSFFSQYPPLLWALISLTLILISILLSLTFSYALHAGNFVGSSCAVMVVILVLSFKVGFTATDSPELLSFLSADRLATLRHISLVTSARLVFIVLAIDLAWIAVGLTPQKHHGRLARGTFLTAVHDVIGLFLLVQTRTENIPLYLLFYAQLYGLRGLRLSPVQTGISTLLLAHAAFFAMGNSNAISSVDLSNAYNGVTGYNVVAVGALVFAGNWAGPIWWALAGIRLLVNEETDGAVQEGVVDGAKAGFERRKPLDGLRSGASTRKWIEREHKHLEVSSPHAHPPESSSSAETDALPSRYTTFLLLATTWTTASLLAVMLSCTILRTHLFIWTVFSPKYLYSIAWSLGFHCFAVIGLCGGLWKLIGRE